MKEGDRALVNGAPCVRVSMGKLAAFAVCNDCPHNVDESIRPYESCDSSCGPTFEWVREITYIELLLEQ